jgi:GNAT superfamily N-acetyltransferase
MTQPVLDDVRIRPYGWYDEPRLRRMSAQLSGRSLHQRFFSGTPYIPEYYVHALASLDHWNHDALAGILDDEIVGIAEYVRHARDSSRAEVAVLVTDEWQRHGLGGRLTAYLAELAFRRGIWEFSADVLLDNRGGLAAVRSGWPAVIPCHQDGAAHFRLPLGEPLVTRA